VLVKVDHDNPMDVYAAGRLARLQARYLQTGSLIDDVFREVGPTFPPVQFLLVDDQLCLLTKIQKEHYNRNLDLIINKLQIGRQFSKTANKKQFEIYSGLFDQAWTKSSPIDASTRQVSPQRLKAFLKRYKGAHKARSERELHLLLTGYLQGLFDFSIVDCETTVGKTRIDLLVGKGAQHQRLGIEVKLASDDNSIDRIVGQIRRYRKEYADLLLVIANPKFSPQRRAHLVDELAEIGVGLVEVV
jgi:hypothetical protein